MGKNIWILHHYADPPDGHWTGTFDLYKLLVKKGHRVTIVSSSFSHYSREETRLEKGVNYREQDYEGVRVVFVRTTPYARNDWRRLLNMVLYGLRATLWGRRQKERPDIIVTATPHPFCSYAALRLAKKFRVPLLLELHDLWLEYLLDTRMVAKANPAYRLIRRLETSCYDYARRILMLWPRMDLYLAQYGVPREKIVWTPLGIDFESLEPIAPKGPIDNQPFIVMCTGSFGPASNVWEIVECAKILRSQGHDRIRFSLVGGGPEKEKLVKFTEDNRLANVEFRGIVAKEQIRKC
ncbi:MAG: glycosyltransferase family 4 protein, partial [Deltaproteobacteria bacterium]|nr:glycosyltransferase family 4 protein [Deltaproteobacteria bacterium]